jgi:hypothetical protein
MYHKHAEVAFEVDAEPLANDYWVVLIRGIEMKYLIAHYSSDWLAGLIE